MCWSLGCRDVNLCHQTSATHERPASIKTTMVGALSHVYALMETWLMINTSKTVPERNKPEPR